MKIFTSIIAAIFLIGYLLFLSNQASSQSPEQGYVLQKEKDIARAEPGPHDGGGQTTAYSFFNDVPGYKLAFRKRVLHPGAAISYHLQKEDEVYYILGGTGQMKMNGKTFIVEQGDAILTRPGSSHGLKQTGNNDLTILIVYEKQPA